MTVCMQGALMVDIEGKRLTPEDRRLLLQPEVAGLILFARNITHPRQVRELCHSVRALRPDLIIAVDQEGGRVQRIRDGVVRLPSMGQIARSDDAERLAEHCGWLMATEVLAIGIDISLAPVLDLDYGRNAVIGERGFGNDPERVALLAGAFIRGMNAAGMAACGKHFPGHGWVELDSHVAIPTDTRSLEELRKADLVPFSRLSWQLSAIMPAHIIYSKVDDKPAGFSKRWIQEILRGELGFQGVIFTDDLSMVGASGVGDISDRVEFAFRAGCDVALVCNHRASAERALETAQRLQVKPSPRLGQMRGFSFARTDYRQQPRWLEALKALREAQLVG